MSTFQFARSAVARVSKSFPDLLHFGSSRERSEYRKKSQSFKNIAPIPNRHIESQLNTTNSEDISDEETSQSDDASKQLVGNKATGFTASSLQRLPESTSPVLQIRRGSMRNVEILRRNDNILSTESICNVEYRKEGDLCPSDVFGKEDSPADSTAVVSESRMFTKCKDNSRKNETVYTVKDCKEKQIHLGTDAHIKLRRSWRQFRPKSESRYESNLLSRQKKKQTNDERLLVGQWSQSSTDQDDEDDYLPVTVWNERRLCKPSIDSHQNIVHIEKSSNIVVNTSTSAGKKRV